jgi:hypothetical protein
MLRLDRAVGFSSIGVANLPNGAYLRRCPLEVCPSGEPEQSESSVKRNYRGRAKWRWAHAVQSRTRFTVTLAFRAIDNADSASVVAL